MPSVCDGCKPCIHIAFVLIWLTLANTVMSHEPRLNTLRSSNEESGRRENGFIPETVKGTAVPTVPLFTPITSGPLLEPRHGLASVRNVGWTSWSHFCDVCACPTSTPCNHMLSLLSFEYFFPDLRRIRSRIPPTHQPWARSASRSAWSLSWLSVRSSKLRFSRQNMPRRTVESLHPGSEAVWSEAL